MGEIKSENQSQHLTADDQEQEILKVKPDSEVSSGEDSEDIGSSDIWQDAFDAAEAIETTKKAKADKKEKHHHHHHHHEKAKKEVEEEKKAKPEESRSSDKTSNDFLVLEKKLEFVKEELEKKDTQLKRLAADFENFRRRQTIEKEDLLKYAGEKLILDILPVLDNFERAINSSKDAKDISSVISGIELIHKQLLDAMTKNGVEHIVALDNIFDPNFHEAVQQFVNDDKPDQTITHELQKGYTLYEKVIRPSMVVVSTTSN